MSSNSPRISDLVTQVALVQQSLDTLRIDVSRIDAALTSTLEKQQSMLQILWDASTRNASFHEEIEGKLKELESRVKNLEELAPAMRAMIWVAGVLGVSLIALIWSLIVGQAQVVFR